MKKMVLFGALVAAVGIAQAAEWRPVAAGSDEVWFLDSSGITNVSGTRVAWVRTVKKSDVVTVGGVRYGLTKYASHCKTRGLQVLSWADYDSNGKIKESGSTPLKVGEIFPDSVGESLFGYMCGSSTRLQAIKPVKDTFAYTDEYFSPSTQ